jgi:hypothetical protein
MFRILAIGFVIYVVWKIAEGFFRAPKAQRQERPPAPEKPKNQDRDGFTEFEEVE